ncbi:6473_t:CDS:2, partial [Gigaspora margarita]
MPGNKTVIQTWIIFQLFNVIPLSFLCLQFLHKGKHYTIACLSITIIFDCIISVPIALQYYFIDSNSISSTTPKNISTNDPIVNNNTYSTNNTDMEFWNETSSTMSLVALDDNANLEPICIAQAYALFSIQLSIGFWIFCLMINMWLLLVKATSDIETKWFKFHIIFSWVVPLLITFTTFMLLKPQANFGVDTSYYYCIVTGGLIHLVANHAPFLLCMFIGLGLGNAYFNTILTYSLFLIFGTTKEALRSLLRCTCCFKNLFPKRSSIATFINNPNPKHNSTEMEMTMVEHPPSSFGNLKRTKSFSKYKIGDDVLKFEEAGWGNVFRNYSIGRNGRHNYGGKHKFDKSGGDNSASSVIHSAINSVKSLKSLKSLNRFLE